MTAGRPSDYSHEIVLEICLAVATSSKGIRKICDENEHFPEPGTIYRWLFKHEEFRELYAHAREHKVWAIADEILEIGDDGTNDFIEELDKKDPEGKKTAGWRYNGEAVQRSKLRSDDRKWLLSKLCPKTFGEAMTLKGDKENPLIMHLAKALDERMSRLPAPAAGPVVDAVAKVVTTAAAPVVPEDED